MKHLKLYEDLIKDLSDLGVTEDRCQIKVAKLINGKELPWATIALPDLNTEKRITDEDIMTQLRGDTCDFNFNKTPGSEVYQREFKRKVKMTAEAIERLNKPNPLKVAFEELCEWFRPPAKAEVIIDGKVILEVTNNMEKVMSRAGKSLKSLK